MNEDTAAKRGYEKTGHYSRGGDANYARMEVKLAEIRKAGYKALIVKVPDSPYSRGYCKGACGYSIMTEPRYRLDRAAAESRITIDTHAARTQEIMARHMAAARKEIEEAETRKQAAEQWLKDHGYAPAQHKTTATCNGVQTTLIEE